MPLLRLVQAVLRYRPGRRGSHARGLGASLASLTAGLLVLLAWPPDRGCKRGSEHLHRAVRVLGGNP